MTTRNSIPDLCELKVRVQQNSEDAQALDCLVDLRIFKGEIPLGEEECEIAFERVFLSVETEGISVVTGTRFGEPKKQNAVPSIKQSQTESAEDKSACLGVDASTKSRPQLMISAKKEYSAETVTSETLSDTDNHYRVKARPNDRWEITEHDRCALDGTYMESEALFSGQLQEMANRGALAIELKVKQRDLAINQVFRNENAFSIFNKMTENQKRLMDIFIAKSLSNALYGNRTYIGEIVLSEHSYEHEE